VVSIGQEIEVTILGVDVEKRRISLSMVEQARQEQDATQARERADAAAMVSQANEPRSLGSFADLLAASRNKPR
jgi:small subunit ribosomal protein S1